MYTILLNNSLLCITWISGSLLYSVFLSSLKRISRCHLLIDDLLASSSYPSSILTSQPRTFRQTLLSLCQWLLSLLSYPLSPRYCNHLSDKLLFPLLNSCSSFTLTGSLLLKLSPSYDYPGCYAFHVQIQRLLYTVSIQLHVVYCVLG